MMRIFIMHYYQKGKNHRKYKKNDFFKILEKFNFCNKIIDSHKLNVVSYYLIKYNIDDSLKL